MNAMLFAAGLGCRGSTPFPSSTSLAKGSDDGIFSENGGLIKCRDLSLALVEDDGDINGEKGVWLEETPPPPGVLDVTDRDLGCGSGGRIELGPIGLLLFDS